MGVWQSIEKQLTQLHTYLMEAKSELWRQIAEICFPDCSLQIKSSG